MRKEFERCTPEAVGIPSGAVMELLDTLEGGGFTQMHGLMIMRHGKVCAEGWWAPYAPQLHHALHSLSKTWTATAVGLAEREGLLSLDDHVCDILPERMPRPLTERARLVTVRDLLMMASGSEQEDAGYPKDWLERFFSLSMTHEPGKWWRYDTHGTAVLSAVVEKVSGLSMVDYLDTRLFGKIGIDGRHVMCRVGDDGTCLGGHGMFTTNEDDLRLMKLYLDGGVWEGERLLNERFVKDATSPLQDTSPAHAHTPWIYDNCCGYGYQIWMCRPEGSYRADGAYGQFCVVVPSLDLIVSIHEAGYLGEHMSHNELELLKGKIGADQPVHGPQATLNALFDILLPQLSDEPLTPGKETKRLEERLRRLAIPRPAASVTDRTERPLDVELTARDGGISFAIMYGMAKHNEDRPGAERIRLRCADGRLTLVSTEAGTERTIVADMRGGRATGKLVYTDHHEIVTDVACAAWWNAEDELELSVLWYETEDEDRFRFRFEGGRCEVTEWVETGVFGPRNEKRAVYTARDNGR